MPVRQLSAALVFGAAITVAACSGGGEGSSSPALAPTFTVSGTVSGLAGTGLVLQNNGAGNLAITQNGKFTVSAAVASGTPYKVTVLTQPTGPRQTCTVANGSGTVSGADVTNVALSCSTDPFTVSGTVSGLAGTGLILQNNGAGNLAITQNGSFTVSAAVVSGTPYNVTVLTQPTGPRQTCTVANGSGTVSGADVTNVALSCSTDTLTIGGTVSGYNGSGITLRNNGGDTLTLGDVSSFTFSTAIPDGTAYAVTVSAQPPGQVCTVAGGSGILIGANVSNVAITCINRFRLLASSPMLPSAGTSQVDLTAVVLDANGQAVSGTSVTFSTATDPSAFISDISNGGFTDANGVVTAKLNLGANRGNRRILVTAIAAAGDSASTGVDVTGTTITIDGNTSLPLGGNTILTFSLKDSAGTALQNFPMALASANGNTIAPAAGITDVAGQLVAVVTATQGANDVITATAAGTDRTQALTISAASFAFTAPAPSVDIPLNTPTPVSAHWTNTGAPMVGQQVTFTTSRGTMTGSPSTTNGTGDTPGVSISSTSAGPATITASGPNNTPSASLDVVFVATTASSIAVQAVPSVVQFTTNSPGQTNNISTITVVVRDTSNNLVKNASITFTLTDATGGFLAAGSAITDVSGMASVNYTAGTTSSAQNGVVVTATVDKVNGVAIAPITGSALLTVTGQALFVRLGSDNLVRSVPPFNLDNKTTWAALVTDAIGNPVVGETVRFTLRPGRFSKGSYLAPAQPPQQWTQIVAVTCPNEDLNVDGILDPGEDFNGNSRLDPGNVATVNATATTDASGIATIDITYPKDHASWTEVILEARTGVAGNDPPTLAAFFLGGLLTDYSDVNVAPPGVISPYGLDGSCASSL
jgi:hypothetical protein